MAIHTQISATEAADRLALRELIDAYAFCADSRDAQGQMALFTTDTVFEVFMDAKDPTPTQVVRGRDDLFPVFDNLNTYPLTMHFNGQSRVEIDGDTATGLTYCRAHHIIGQGDARQIMIATIRYIDRMVKQDGAWLFSNRKLMVDWTETRPCHP
ncbi:MAG: nuclear transport factor 2 family protein [Paracoccus sp. (in: a-proteobacteria)]|uniref:nuclear transport factor 2 family protein n=1 Tax=Paracoccus sp. TaxID=267 RepID=UPI0026DF0544|nr:nuclear transport factor 2 family protein [Paracoccus sp. (in: a-proteobacteria)]MDO5633241.1 nuclear transport factor 2 family protein [Paracoccus sp. (in: a-proteobacteria)]